MSDQPIITPTKVLYQFDGPLIFVAQHDGVECYFHAMADGVQGMQYLVGPMASECLNALTEGKLSVLGAINSCTSYELIDLDFNMQISSRRDVKKEDFASLLPTPGTGLYHWQGACPDELEVAGTTQKR